MLIFPLTVPTLLNALVEYQTSIVALKRVREVVDGTSVEKGNVRGTAKHTHAEHGHTSSSMLSMSFKLFFLISL